MSSEGRKFTLTKSQAYEANESACQHRQYEGFLSANSFQSPDTEEVGRNFWDPKQELDQEDAQSKLTHAQREAEVAQS